MSNLITVSTFYSETSDVTEKPEVDTDASNYLLKIQQEQERYKHVLDVNDLPPIFHYWSHTYLRPMVEEFEIAHPDDWFANNLIESAARVDDKVPLFISIGAGNCDTEVRVAKLLRARGMESFMIECLDMNEAMLERGKAMAVQEGVADCVAFVNGDFNDWHANGRYAGVMANQSLHHVLNLEGLFDEVRSALQPEGMFVISDIIGRNGHQRWPEALAEVHRFWQELPDIYRYNQLLGRHEQMYENWDCSNEGFEGIRAQDILPLLLERFDFYRFIAFGNVIDPFVDRAFGHNFDADAPWDRAFIDRIHAADEDGFAKGTLKPTHMFAVLTLSEPPRRHYSRGLTPESCVRDSSQ